MADRWRSCQGFDDDVKEHRLPVATAGVSQKRQDVELELADEGDPDEMLDRRYRLPVSLERSVQEHIPEWRRTVEFVSCPSDLGVHVFGSGPSSRPVVRSMEPLGALSFVGRTSKSLTEAKSTDSVEACATMEFRLQLNS